MTSHSTAKIHVADGEVIAGSLPGRALRLAPKTGTVEWPGEVDLDPEVLYGRYGPASGHRIERRIVQEPVTTAR